MRDHLSFSPLFSYHMFNTPYTSHKGITLAVLFCAHGIYLKSNCEHNILTFFFFFFNLCICHIKCIIFRKTKLMYGVCTPGNLRFSTMHCHHCLNQAN